MKDLVIKSYEDVYREQIINLILEIQQNEFNIPITREDQPDLGDIPNFYQSGNGNFWVAVQHDQVVGTLALLDIGNHQGVLRKMFVNANVRGHQFGVAKLLLDQLLNWSGQHHIRELYLGTTDKFFAAHRFYGKNGFVQIDKLALPDQFPIMKVDTKFYVRKLMQES